MQRGGCGVEATESFCQFVELSNQRFAFRRLDFSIRGGVISFARCDVQQKHVTSIIRVNRDALLLFE
jgi:hypothetical protein